MILENVRRLCAERGITVNHAEVKCGFSHGAIKHWDKHPPTITRAKILCDFLEIPMEELFREEFSEVGEGE